MSSVGNHLTNFSCHRINRINTVQNLQVPHAVTKVSSVSLILVAFIDEDVANRLVSLVAIDADDDHSKRKKLFLLLSLLGVELILDVLDLGSSDLEFF